MQSSLSILTNKVFTQAQYDELNSLVKGPVFRPAETEFLERISTFNGKIKPMSQILVSPLDAKDVSAVVRFCTKHDLSPSVKAGGYGIAGWAVAGDVVIDMSMIRDLDIEPPIATEDGYTWTSLKDMSTGSEERKVIDGVTDVKPETVHVQEIQMAEPSTGHPKTTRTTSAKRRREDSPPIVTSQPAQQLSSGDITHPSIDDAHLRSYDAASLTVGSFLRGPALPHVEGDVPREPPRNRPRLHSPGHRHMELPVLQASRQASSESATSSGGEGFSTASSNDRSTGTTTSTSATSVRSPSVDGGDTDNKPKPFLNADPFGYIPSVSSARRPIYNKAEPSIPSIPPVSAMNIFGSFGAWRNTGVTVGAGPSGSSPPLQSPFGFNSIPSASLSFSPSPRSMQAPSVANPIHSHAYVTFGAGMRQKEVDMYTAEQRLEGTNRLTGQKEERAVPYHVPSSAHPVGSSIMLLAGFGFISRMYGLSVDNLVEVEMVLADGRIVIINKDDDPDLWWAVRGAGPAFGIATRYKAKAFPVPVVFAGNLIYRFHRATAASLIRHFRDCIKGAPRELYANFFLTTGPANKDSLVVIQMCYAGSKEKGQEYLNAISSWDGDRPLLNEVNEKTYLNQQDSVAQVLRGKRGRQWFIRSDLIHSLPDEVISRTVMQFGDTPIGCTWIFELSGGAIGDFEDTCLPKEQREAIWTVAALHQWDMGIDDPRCITSAEEWFQSTIAKVSVGGPFPTFLGRHETPARVMACYGKNWGRLVELKRKYDPHHLFKNNFWPLDVNGQPVEQSYNEPPSP